MDLSRSLVGGLLTIVAGVLWLIRPFTQSDIWWHLATGRWMWTHHAIPRQDPFSSTELGHAWIDHEWLFDGISFAFWKVGGLTAVLLLKILLISAAMFFVWKRFERWPMLWLFRWAGALVVFWAARHGWAERADLTSVVCLSCLFWIFDDRGDSSPKNRTLWLAGLFIFWANSHGAFLLGLLIVAAIAIGRMIDEKKWDSSAFGWIVIAGLATLVNPYGFHLHQSLVHAAWALQSGYITEWRRTPWDWREFFWVGLFLFWGTWLARWSRGHASQTRRVLPAAVLSYVAVSQIRNVPYFAIAVLPWLFDWWFSTREDEPVLLSPPMQSTVRPIILGGAALLAFVSARGAAIGIDRLSQPIGAIDFLQAEHLGAHFFNEYNFGGYWIWRFGESAPVFIDGRLHTVDGYLRLFKEIEQAQRATPAEWNAFLEPYQIQGVLLAYPPMASPASVLRAYFPRERWALVYWDDVGIIFLRREKQNDPIIKENEFLAIDPDLAPVALAAQAARASPGLRKEMDDEARRNLWRHPESFRAKEIAQLIEQSSIPR